MASVCKRSFSLTAVQAKYIDDQVASGAFASGSEVIREGLRVLKMRDAAVERWLKDDVTSVPVAEPDKETSPAPTPQAERASPMERVFDRLGPLGAKGHG